MSKAYTAGIDLGSRMTKAVILSEDGTLMSKSKAPTGVDITGAAEKSLQKALDEAGLNRDEVVYVASTGFGRYQVPFRDIQITEMTCHAKGAIAEFPKTRSILDVGAQNSRAMRVEPNSRVEAFRMNDKCASGAGRFLERVSKSLELELEDIGHLSLQAKDPQEISSVCAVLAESEVINHVTEGRTPEDILAGAHKSIADRVANLLKQMGVEEEVTLTGGISNNLGMVRALEQSLGIKMNVSKAAEYAGAHGAALWAIDRWHKKNEKAAA